MEERLEKEKLERAIKVINALSEGIDFYTGEILDNNNILNDTKYKSLFKYIEEILKYKTDINNHKTTKKPSFVITKEQIEQIEIPNEILGVNNICKYINKYVDSSKTKSLIGQDLNGALAKMGVIESKKINNKINWYVTDKYKEGYGIIPKTYVNDFGTEYITLNYDSKGQKFILDNLIDMLKLIT